MPVLLCMVAACESPSSQEEDISEALADTTASAEASEDLDYRVFLAGALTDTLQGDALFGRVVKAGSSQERLLVELVTGGDFTGGFFISLGDSALPAPGTYDLVDVETGGPETHLNEYGIVYRKGLILDLVSTAGTLTLDVVTDTLIQGSFNATLTGELRLPTTTVEQGEVNARGQFRATPGGVGFILGL